MIYTGTTDLGADVLARLGLFRTMAIYHVRKLVVAEYYASNDLGRLDVSNAQTSK